jgi:nucleoside-triphosphatase THEP1
VTVAVRGFLTEELRERGERVGFRIQTLDGQTATLAHVRLKTAHRDGRAGSADQRGWTDTVSRAGGGR